MSKIIITISRQFGSGGREVGTKLAEKLGIPVYDKEYLADAAEKNGFTKAMFDKLDERTTSSFLYSLSVGQLRSHIVTDANPSTESAFLPDQLFKWQSGKIRELAAEGSAVFVGRAADYVLRNDPNHVSIFIHAPLEARVKRIMDRYGVREEDARRIVRTNEKNRSSYYTFYTDRKWGDPENYDICIDSSRLGVDATVDLLASILDKYQA